jgi:hypothetical protein
MSESTVDRAFALTLYAQDGDVDLGASLLAADPASDQELARRGRELVRRAWERGWHPADLHRMVTRELEGPDTPHAHLAAALIRAETARYDALPPRWAAQLDALPDAAQAPREDRFTAATTALELYRLLLRLPAIEPVGPVPGEALTTPVVGEPRALARIRALLAKAEATGYPPEAEALSAKAQELMARHSVDEALLASRTHAKDTPRACRIGVDAPYETAKAVLLAAVAGANRCQAVWNSAFGFSTVVGFEPDLEAVELLHTSLLVQATAAMTRAEAEQRKGGRKRTKTFRQSFLAAYAHRIGDRLAAVATEVTAEAAGELDGGRAGLLPVLAAREVAVTERTEELFPETVTTRMRGVTDEAGWREGRSAADRTHLP